MEGKSVPKKKRKKGGGGSVQAAGHAVAAATLAGRTKNEKRGFGERMSETFRRVGGRASDLG
jgi:hypothetical protein